MPRQERNPTRQPRRKTSSKSPEEAAAAAVAAARYYVEHCGVSSGRVLPRSLPRPRLKLREEHETEWQEYVAKKRNEAIASRPWNGPTTQRTIAAKFKVKDRTVRRWANNQTKGPVEVKKEGSMFYWRPWPD